MNPGDKVRIVSGPYKGCKALLKRRDAANKAWYAWIDGVLEIVYESEVKHDKKSV